MNSLPSSPAFFDRVSFSQLEKKSLAQSLIQCAEKYCSSSNATSRKIVVTHCEGRTYVYKIENAEEKKAPWIKTATKIAVFCSGAFLFLLAVKAVFRLRSQFVKDQGFKYFSYLPPEIKKLIFCDAFRWDTPEEVFSINNSLTEESLPKIQLSQEIANGRRVCKAWKVAIDDLIENTAKKGKKSSSKDFSIQELNIFLYKSQEHARFFLNAFLHSEFAKKTVQHNQARMKEASKKMTRSCKELTLYVLPSTGLIQKIYEKIDTTQICCYDNKENADDMKNPLREICLVKEADGNYRSFWLEKYVKSNRRDGYTLLKLYNGIGPHELTGVNWLLFDEYTDIEKAIKKIPDFFEKIGFSLFCEHLNFLFSEKSVTGFSRKNNTRRFQYEFIDRIENHWTMAITRACD